VLVTFKTNSYADITMFGDVAEALLGMMGQSGNVPGAIMADDVENALSSLKIALEDSPEPDSAEAIDLEDDDQTNRVALKTRAMPLLGLLESAVASHDNVQWDA
jgi:hypothetical protein